MAVSNRKIINYYKGEDSAGEYDRRRYGGYMGEYRTALIRQNLGIALKNNEKEKPVILEVAPGSGVVTRILLDKYANTNIFGLDSSPQMLAYLKKKYKKEIAAGNLKLTEGDALHIPYPDKKFDLVISLRLLIHYNKPNTYLKEMARVLKPGGLLVVDTHNFFRADLPVVIYKRYIKNSLKKSKVYSYYLYPWEINQKYQARGLNKILTVGHKLIPPFYAIEKLIGQKLMLSIERRIAESEIKYLCADSYLVFRKNYERP